MEQVSVNVKNVCTHSKVQDEAEDKYGKVREFRARRWGAAVMQGAWEVVMAVVLVVQQVLIPLSKILGKYGLALLSYGVEWGKVKLYYAEKALKRRLRHHRWFRVHPLRRLTILFVAVVLALYIFGTIGRWLVFPVSQQEQRIRISSFSEVQMQARLDAQLKASKQARIEDEVEKRVHEMISSDFAKFEKNEETLENAKMTQSGKSEMESESKEIIEQLVQKFRSTRTFTTIEPPRGEEFILNQDLSHQKRKKSGKRKTQHQYLVDPIGEDEESDRPSLLEAGLIHLGYRRISGTEALYDKNLMWINTRQQSCESNTIKSAMMQLPNSKRIVMFCNGDAQWVTHFERKDVLDQRIRWYDVKLHRYPDCIMASDFLLPTFLVNPTTDFDNLKQTLHREVNTQQNGLFIIKHQIPSKDTVRNSMGLPAVVHDPFKALQHLANGGGKRSRGKYQLHEGLVVQPFKQNPLLWEGRKFVIRTFALIASSNPLTAFYHDGIILKSLDRMQANFPKKLKKTMMSVNYWANVTTRQWEHHEYSTRKDKAYACMEDLHEYLSAMYTSSLEMKHYVDLILRPYLKRLMLFTIQALRREHEHETPVWTAQHMCFDFMIDSNWNVYLLDVSAQCDVQSIGGLDFSSTCKRELVQAMGVDSISIVEQLMVRKKKKKNQQLDLGSFQPLFDGGIVGGGENTEASPIDAICKRSAYQGFRERQTFGKRVVESLIPLDGKPKTKSDQEMGLTRDESKGPWKCPKCGYTNHAKSKYCDQCGSTEFGLVDFFKGKGERHVDHEEHHDIVKETTPSPVRMNENAEFDAFLNQHTGGTSPISSQHHEVTVKSTMCAGKRFDVKESIEIVGHDIEPLRTSTYHACCSACSVNHRCKGFTFIAETYQCWLKTDIGSEGHHVGIISGIVREAGVKSIDQFNHFMQGHQQQQSRSAGTSSSFSTTTQFHPSSEKAKHEYYRKRLTEIFTEHDPNKLSKVDLLLDRYRGNEERFVQRTIQQYEKIERIVQERKMQQRGGGKRYGFQQQQQHEARDVHGLTKHDYHDRLKNIFMKHDPSMLDKVDEMLEQFKDREMHLLQYLMQKYN